MSQNMAEIHRQWTSDFEADVTKLWRKCTVSSRAGLCTSGVHVKKQTLNIETLRSAGVIIASSALMMIDSLVSYTLEPITVSSAPFRYTQAAR